LPPTGKKMPPLPDAFTRQTHELKNSPLKTTQICQLSKTGTTFANYQLDTPTGRACTVIHIGRTAGSIKVLDGFEKKYGFGR